MIKLSTHITGKFNKILYKWANEDGLIVTEGLASKESNDKYRNNMENNNLEKVCSEGED